MKRKLVRWDSWLVVILSGLWSCSFVSVAHAPSFREKNDSWFVDFVIGHEVYFVFSAVVVSAVIYQLLLWAVGALVKSLKC